MRIRRVCWVYCIAFGLLLALPAGAAEWEKQTSPVSTSLWAVSGNSAHNVYAVGDGGVILHYDGSEWSDISVETIDTNFKDVWCSPSGDVFAVGQGKDGGAIYRFLDSSWTELSTPTESYLRGVWGSSETSVWAVGYDGTILKYDGVEWVELANPWDNTQNRFWGIWGNDQGEVFAVGDNGNVLLKDDMGWSIVQNPLKGTLHPFYGVWGSNANDIYVVGGQFNDSRIIHYNGADWTEITDHPLYETAAPLQNVWGTSSDNVYAISRSGAIIHLDDSGEWKEETFSAPNSNALNGIWGTSADNIFAVGASGTILHYPPVVPGDINHSQIVDLADAIAALQVTAGISSTEIYLDADVNGDGRIGTAEAIYAIQTAANN